MWQHHGVSLTRKIKNIQRRIILRFTGFHGSGVYGKVFIVSSKIGGETKGEEIWIIAGCGEIRVERHDEGVSLLVASTAHARVGKSAGDFVTVDFGIIDFDRDCVAIFPLSM